MGRLTALFSLLFIAAPSAAAADWLSLKSAHFLVIGDASPRQLQTIALKLEQFREVVGQLNPALLGEEHAAPVVVLVFRDNRAYAPFLPRDNGRPIRVGGFFQSGIDVNYIALTLQAGDRAYPAILHEFSHLLLRGWLADAPLWFNEGIAEYYSTFEVSGDGRRASIGRAIAAHRNLLQSRRLPFGRFFAVEHSSPEYTRDTTDREVFYAQSWAIVHHAFHGDSKRREQLLAFVGRLAAGEATEPSFREAYGGLELRELESEVQAYATRPAYGYAIVELPESVVTRIEPKPAPLSDEEVEAWLGDLLAHMDRGDEAIPRLEKALAAAPDLALAHSSLGTLLMREGRTADAMTHFERAVAAGTENDRVHFLYAYALLSEGLADLERVRKAARLLERALELRHTYREARLLLADAYLASSNHPGVRDLLTPIVRGEPANHRAALQLGESLLRLDDLDGARSVLGPVMARATDERARERARYLLAQAAGLQLRRETRLAAGITTPAAARPNIVIPELRTVADDEQRVYGIFESIDCKTDGMILVVRTTNTVVRTRFARFPDVDFISYGTNLGRELSCGVQDATEVYLTWRPTPGTSDGTAGTAVALEFLPVGFIPSP
jgi:tetratricopeptide (TPR) repeat protein